MGSLPDFSVLKGVKRNLEKRKLHLLFEERLQAANNYNDIAIIFKGKHQVINKLNFHFRSIKMLPIPHRSRKFNHYLRTAQ